MDIAPIGHRAYFYSEDGEIKRYNLPHLPRIGETVRFAYEETMPNTYKVEDIVHEDKCGATNEDIGEWDIHIYLTVIPKENRRF